MKDRVDQLIEILLDKSGREDERHDAAMYLFDYDDIRVINTFFKVASDEKEFRLLLDAVGEGIGEIWGRNNMFDSVKLKGLTKIARDSVIAVIEGKNPELLKRHGFFLANEGEKK